MRKCTYGYFQDLMYLSGQNFKRRSNVVYSGQMNRECRQFRLTCYRDTRYRLSKSTSISDASGENRDIDFKHRSRGFEKNSVHK